MTNIDYDFKQSSYDKLVPPEYQTGGTKGWPEHHSFGSVEKSSDFNNYSIMVPDLNNPGYAV